MNGISCNGAQACGEMVERVATSMAAVRQEMKRMPPPVKVQLSVQGSGVSLHLEMDSYQVVMDGVLQVPTLDRRGRQDC